MHVHRATTVTGHFYHIIDGTQDKQSTHTRLLAFLTCAGYQVSRHEIDDHQNPVTSHPGLSISNFTGDPQQERMKSGHQLG